MTALATKDLASAVAAWAKTAAPALQDAYAYRPDDRGQLPDVQALITSSAVKQADPRWPARGHALLRVFLIGVLIVIEPDPVPTATSRLTDICDALTFSVLDDRTLGSLLAPPGASSLTSFTDDGIVNYEDGTIGYAGVFQLAVASYVDSSR